MQHPATTPDSTDATMSTPTQSLASLIGRITATINHFSPGDLAGLRRSADQEMPGAAFWKLMIMLPEYDQKQRVDQWLLIFTAMAYMKGLYKPEVPLGKALLLAGYSEARLTRLLNAKQKALRHEIMIAARFLAAKGQESNFTQVVELLQEE